MQHHEQTRHPLTFYVCLCVVSSITLSGCTEIEYETSYFADRHFPPRSNMPHVVDQPELALRHAGYVDIGALLVKGKGARIRIVREAARRGADLIYLDYYSGPQSRWVGKGADDDIVTEREAYHETYFEAKLFRLEPELALERGFLFTLAFPAMQMDAGGYLVTPEMRLYYVKKFLQAGADPNAMRGGDPLIYCVVRYWHRNYGNRLSGIVRLLLEAGADPSVPSSSGETAYDCVRDLVAGLEEVGPQKISPPPDSFRPVETLKWFHAVRDLFQQYGYAR